jgi:hypothetical protein
MTNAVRDNNGVTALLGTSSADGVTTMRVLANPTTHAAKISNGTTGSDVGNDNSSRDDNYTTTIMAVSATDGVTPVPIFLNSSNNALLVRTN